MHLSARVNEKGAHASQQSGRGIYRRQDPRRLYDPRVGDKRPPCAREDVSGHRGAEQVTKRRGGSGRKYAV